MNISCAILIQSFLLSLALFPSPSVFCVFVINFLNLHEIQLKALPQTTGCCLTDENVNVAVIQLTLSRRIIAPFLENCKIFSVFFFTTLFAQKHQFELPEGIPEIFRRWHYASTLFRSLLINRVFWNSLWKL
jgi:hypothetical protein